MRTKTNTPQHFLRAKSGSHKLSMATCYDYTFAKLIARSSVDAILVGDSAAMVMHGHETTLTATLDMMCTHAAAVVRGAPEKLIVVDMPFLTYRKGIPAAMDAAHALMSTGAHALKLEGVDGHEDVIAHLVQSGIPVMGHLGLQPQSVKAYGGFKLQGRAETDALRIAHQAERLEELGAFSLVLECVPSPLAERITRSRAIPVIGIGAGAACDGQVLVLQDLLGMNSDFRPRFARQFCESERCILDALESFDTAVKSATFPSLEESYT